ncbi:hypothetical protein [Rhodococcus sp. (in: high G+C Gram-positive bacteria)]|uniref:hypothetical protein n=1 Tax=Rhodococcus sp. TaxID=1831 RepID=UPI003B8A7CCF
MPDDQMLGAAPHARVGAVSWGKVLRSVSWDAGGMRVDEKWVFGSAAAPVVFAGVLVVAGVVASVAGVSSVPGEMIAHWFLFAVFGAVWFLPGVVVSVIGGGLLIRSPRVGRPAALVGVGLLCAASLSLVVSGFVEAFSAPPPSGAPQFVSQLSVVEAFVFAVPFVAMAIGSANAGRLVVTTRGSTSPTSG